MPINTDLLIAAPMLQDYLVDKDGKLMSGGTITMYHDNSRTTLKNWYYQTGPDSTGAYSYPALPNPLTLSAAGTICDINGVDTIPFYYPYSELDETVDDPYYVTIVNYAQTNQITRANFPFNREEGVVPTALTDSLNNLIVNGGFWQNIQPNTLNITPFTSFSYTTTDTVVAPSQHDGFRLPDVRFVRTNTSSSDTATFTPFPFSNSAVIDNFIVPEYYLSHNCTVAGSGVTQKYYQFPISLHINTLSNVPYTFSIQAQNSGGTGTGENIIEIFILQDLGTGASSPAPQSIGTITLNSAWTNYTITNIFPSAVGLSLSNAPDDAFYLLVGMPTNSLCTINFTNPSIFLTDGLIPNNDFQTYDQVDTVINSPRTGDLRTSINTFNPFGWVPMNDGTIGNHSSNGTSRHNQDVWKLFNLIWNLGKTYDSGSNFNPIAQMYTSGGAATNYAGTALTDYNTNNALALTKAMGKVLLGTVPLANLLAATPTLTGFSSVVTASSSTGLLWTTAAANLLNLFLGNTISFTSTTSLVNVISTSIYYIIPISTTTFKIATTFANALAGTAVAYTGAETGTVTAYLQTTGSIEGEYGHTQLATEVAAHIHGLTGQTGTAVSVVSTGGGSTFLTNSPGSNVTNASSAGTAFNVTQPGVFYNIFIKL
jgi:hypothetical protein